MKIKHLINNDCFLKAISIDEQFEGFEEYKNPYEIFNKSLNEYYIVLNHEFNGDELFRSLTKFLSLKTKKSFDIDFESFKNIYQQIDIYSLLSVLINSIEYSNCIPWTQNQTILAKTSEHELVIDKKYLSIANEINQIAIDRSFARKLQDTPSNLMTPKDFVEAMTNYFDGLDVKISLLTKQDLISKKMNLILAVGQGAILDKDEPRMLIIEYLGNKNNDKKIAYVGKGVCFDTGGLNIKPGNHMRWMKYDMSGAAIAGSVLHSIAMNKLKVNAVAVMPLVLNLVDSLAIRPDDVYVSYSGKSVEIDNTDAEGRLILADALTYACKDLKATKIFDIATLTGAMIYCLGETYTGVWATSDELWNEIDSNAKLSGELVWRLPFHHDFKDLLKSKYADIANSVSDIRGGSSRAAMFLKEFVHENCEYAHFDIAGTANKNNCGTGIILNTFYNIAKNNQ